MASSRSPNLLRSSITGSDDCLLKITDTNSNKVVKQLNDHKAGVTAIRFNHLNCHIFASGRCVYKSRNYIFSVIFVSETPTFSYDETIKIWDTRNLKQTLSSLEIGGGVWRIKWDPQNAESILIAGMYSGIFLINFNEDSTLQTMSTFKQHESIAYGADFCYFSSEEMKNYSSDTNASKLIATCSFYDKKLCLSFLK